MDIKLKAYEMLQRVVFILNTTLNDGKGIAELREHSLYLEKKLWIQSTRGSYTLKLIISMIRLLIDY